MISLAVYFFAPFFAFWGWIASPRASIETSAAIFLAFPAGVFMLFVRNVRANKFVRFNDWNVLSARGLALIARSKSSGIVDSLVLRMGAYAESHRPSALAASICL